MRPKRAKNSSRSEMKSIRATSLWNDGTRGVRWRRKGSNARTTPRASENEGARLMKEERMLPRSAGGMRGSPCVERTERTGAMSEGKATELDDEGGRRARMMRMRRMAFRSQRQQMNESNEKKNVGHLSMIVRGVLADERGRDPARRRRKEIPEKDKTLLAVVHGCVGALGELLKSSERWGSITDLPGACLVEFIGRKGRTLIIWLRTRRSVGGRPVDDEKRQHVRRRGRGRGLELEPDK